MILHPKINEIDFLREPAFELFKHSGLLCCIKRISYFGNLNGYVAVDETNHLYEKQYSDHIYVGNTEELKFNGNYIGLFIASLSPLTETGLLQIDLAINVHGGITYSDNHLCGIEEGVFKNLWWFGFDTNHCDDLSPFQSEFNIGHGEYRDFEYVKNQTKSLAEQLIKFQK